MRGVCCARCKSKAALQSWPVPPYQACIFCAHSHARSALGQERLCRKLSSGVLIGTDALAERTCLHLCVLLRPPCLDSQQLVQQACHAVATIILLGMCHADRGSG